MPASAWKMAVALAVGLTGFDTGTRAHDDLAGVDANIVTALDISDSIGRYEEWLEQTGTARAVLHPAFLEAVANGHHGQIGFAVYTWSDGGEYQVIIPWTRIDGPAAARSVAETIQSFRLIDRSDFPGTDEQAASEPRGGGPASVSGGLQGGMTDISGALAFGHGMLQAAPYSASRNVINLFTDGVDNVGEGPDRSRDLAVAAGETVNAIALGRHPDLPGYLAAHVAGGPGSFVMNLTDAAHASRAVEKKFALDLVAFGGSGASPAEL